MLERPLTYIVKHRGIKELLVVDTDDEPFAKLVQREEAVQPDPQEHRPGSSGHDSGVSSKSSKSRNGKRTEDKTRTRPEKSLPREGPSSSKAPESQSPKESSSHKKRRERPSVRVKIPEQHHLRTTSDSLKTPIAETPTIPTPTAPSPTPLSARPKLVTSKDRAPSKHIDTPYPGTDNQSKRDQHILGGSVSIVTEEQQPAQDDPGMLSEKYFWMPSSTLLHSPLDGPKWPVPDVFLPPQSPSVSAALIKFPSRNSRRTAPSSLRDQSPKSEKSSSQSSRSARSGRSGRSQMPRQVENAPPTRPATTTGAGPMRPASPKSRNASRTGRHERRASEVEKPDLDEMIERLEALRRKTQSAQAQRQNYSGTPSQDRPRSPKSRNASRSGRPTESEFSFADRAFNLSRGSIPIGASDSVLASNIPRPQSDILGKNNLTNGSAGCASSRGHYHTSDPERPSSRTEGLPQDTDAPVAHIEPEESRTMLWSEISKIVGEHLGRPDSRESTRGRQRNDSVISTQARQGSHGPPANNRGAASQTRQGNGGMIRSVRDPSLGPPANPDDEIVAEIIFRRPGAGGPNQNSRSNSTEHAGTPGEGPGSTPRRDPSRHSPESDSTPAKKVPSPLSKGDKKSTPGKEYDRKHNSAPAARQEGAGSETDTANPPGLAGSSIHTLNSTKTSPTTPSPHAFEPSTPKAMILGPDYGSFLSTASDPLSSLRFEPLNSALVADKAAGQIDRPRSAIW